MRRQCTKCGKRKLFSAFYKDTSGKYGIRSHCKKCSNANSKQYKQTHKKQIAKCDKKYRKTLKGHLYQRFQIIKQRCNNPKHQYYKNYGGRGIKCLFVSANEFVNYVINGLQVDPRGLQIDRINNNGHYKPGNIRFVTAKINSNNRRKRKCVN